MGNQTSHPHRIERERLTEAQKQRLMRVLPECRLYPEPPTYEESLTFDPSLVICTNTDTDTSSPRSSSSHFTTHSSSSACASASSRAPRRLHLPFPSKRDTHTYAASQLLSAHLNGHANLLQLSTIPENEEDLDPYVAPVVPNAMRQSHDQAVAYAALACPWVPLVVPPRQVAA